MNLKNKKILITGATGGIGNSLVEKFYSLGCLIVATGTSEEKLNNIKKQYPNIIVENLSQMNTTKQKILLRLSIKV